MCSLLACGLWRVACCAPPDPQHGEGAVLHAQCQVDAVGADGRTADGLLHVAAGDQGVVDQTPDPVDRTHTSLMNCPTHTRCVELYPK